MNDDPVLLGAHHRQSRGRDVERARKVALENRIDPLGRKLGPTALAQIGPGVVDDDVQPPERAADRFGNGVHALGVGHVAGLDMRAPSRRFDFLRHRIERLLAAPREHDGGAGTRERHGRGFADPASRAGDPGDLAAQARHVSLPHRMVDTGSSLMPR